MFTQVSRNNITFNLFVIIFKYITRSICNDFWSYYHQMEYHFFSDALRILFKPISKKVVYYFVKKRWNPQNKTKLVQKMSFFIYLFIYLFLGGVGAGRGSYQRLSDYSHIFFVLNFVLEMPFLTYRKGIFNTAHNSILKFKFTVISYKGDLDTWVLLLTINRSDKNTFSITDWSLKTGRSWENKNCI